jgi:hypothetical protein
VVRHGEERLHEVWQQSEALDDAARPRSAAPAPVSSSG